MKKWSAARAPAGRIAYVNGRYLPRAEAKVSVEDRGYQFADGVYEVCEVLGGRLPKTKFGHLAEHRLPDGRILIDSYHCSRYNQNTGRLTAAMFEDVFARALALEPNKGNP